MTTMPAVRGGFVRSLAAGSPGTRPSAGMPAASGIGGTVSEGVGLSRFVAFGKHLWSSGNVPGRATDPSHRADGSVRATRGSSSPSRPSLFPSVAGRDSI